MVGPAEEDLRAEPVALRLIEHKPEVLATLAPAQQAAQRWRDRYAARISHWFRRGRRRWQDAEALAYAELINDWHMLHGRRWPQDLCAGCGKPITDRPALILIDENRVHFENVDCLLPYGKRWRAAGVAYFRAQITRALSLMGIDVPARM